MSVNPQIIAIINLTPDSFSDGGQWQDLDALLAYAHQLWQAGITWWDIGAESTRPGATNLPPEVEQARLILSLTALRLAFPQATLSVDTRKATVADAALSAGADWINDVSGLLYDPLMLATVARHKAGLMLMHSQGTPDTMQLNPSYTHVVDEVTTFLKNQATQAINAGITRLVLDPGFGFGKTLAHNTALFRALPDLVKAVAPHPVLMGTSRKQFLTLNQPDRIPPENRDGLTAMTTALGYQAGVRLFRVHNALDAQRQLNWLNTVINEVNP